MSSLLLLLRNKSYFSIALIFFGFSLIEATWIIYIPYIFENLQLTHGILGIALFAKALGALTAMPLSARIINSIGEGKSAFLFCIAICFSAIGPIVSADLIILCITLFTFGMIGGVLDIAINSVVSYHEKNDNVLIMGSCHGFWSLGGMVGAGLGTMLIPVIDSPKIHMFGVVLIIFILFIFLSKNFKTLRGQHDTSKSSLSFGSIAVLSAALIALVVMMSEGMIADWSGLYLKEIDISNPRIIGLGFAGFSLCMAIGRFTSDYISLKIGSKPAIILGLSIAILGVLLVISKMMIISIIGFSIIGLGLSGIIPEMFRIAGNFKGIEPAKGMAVIAGTGYFGFLLGPVLFGFLAEFSSLHTSFIALGLILISALLITKLIDKS